MDAVLNWLWQGGVVAMALSVMLVALRRARANVRYVVCWVAALVVVGLAAFPSLQSAAPVEIAAIPQYDAIVALPDAWWTSTNVMFGAMVLWASVHLLRLTWAIAAIRRARRRSRPFPAHLESNLPHWRRIRFERRQARLVLSDSVTRAAVLGWGSPVIAVAPSLVRTLDADDLDRVLIHEWAHVQRYDDVVNVLQIALRIVAGWHPALWWIDRRLHAEREIACDEMTVAVSGSAKSYAECLMKLSSMEDAPQRVQMAPAVFTRSGLRARVVKIVSPDRPIAPLWSRLRAAAIVVVLCMLSAAVGSVTLVEVTTLAAPVISAATNTPSASADRPIAVRRSASAPDAQRAPSRRTARSSLAQQPTREQTAPAQQSAPQSTVSQGSHDSEPVAAADTSNAPHVTEVEPQAISNAAPVVPVVSGFSRTAPPPPDPPTVTAQVESAWSGAAAGGTAIGRKSKEAGVATAGAFKRLASRIAGSF